MREDPVREAWRRRRRTLPGRSRREDMAVKTSIRTAACLTLALFAASCAGPTQLARQSERELGAGNALKAYDKAKRALDKDPGHAGARAALGAATIRLCADWKHRIGNLAEVDTLAAAHAALEFRLFRGEAAGYGASIPPDRDFAAREALILDGAAAIHYRDAEVNLAARRPKAAFRSFRATETFVPRFRDARARARRAWELAVKRVAFLPFANQTDVPGLSRELGERIAAEVARRIEAQELTFTELVPVDQVLAQVTVAQLVDLSPEMAVRIGRRLKADRVLRGRCHGLQADTWTDRIHHTIFRHVIERDSSGERESWSESGFEAVVRERQVAVSYDFEVLDVSSRAVVAGRSERLEIAARTVWTDYRAAGDCDDYSLVPPRLRKSDPARARELDQQWSERFGRWTLPALLQAARSDRRRAHYEPAYRREFQRDTRIHPVLCGELPGTGDLAWVAVERVVQPAVVALRELDQKD
jgi:hypothetical protein